MDLLLKVGILIIVLIVIFSVIFLVFVHSTQTGPVTESQAESLVLSDIKSQNPNATVSVVVASAETQPSTGWNIVLAVVYNGTRPCPTLSIQSYNYPATTLVASTDNLYTRDCVIYGSQPGFSSSYVIGSPYIAIAESFESKAPELVDYVFNYGYNDTNVYATFYTNLPASITPLNKTFNNVWLLNYSAVNAPFNQYVVMAQNGTIVGNYTIKR